MEEILEEIFFFVDPFVVKFCLVLVGFVILFDLYLGLARLINGRGPSGCFPFTVIAFTLMVFAKEPLFLSVNAHPVILLMIKVVEAAFLFGILLVVDAFLPEVVFKVYRWLVGGRGNG